MLNACSIAKSFRCSINSRETWVSKHEDRFHKAFVLRVSTLARSSSDWDCFEKYFGQNKTILVIPRYEKTEFRDDPVCKRKYRHSNRHPVDPRTFRDVQK